MSFIKKIFFPKAPKMPVIQMPDPADVPNYDDEQRKLDEARLLKEASKNRRGRQSTILTTQSGLNEIDEEDLNQKTLLEA